MPMPNFVKETFLAELTRRCGVLKRVGRSRSLYEIGNGAVRVYIRYSKVHPGGQTFFGLRCEDLGLLQGHRALVCFLWDGQTEPLFVPFEQYEPVIFGTSTASDGQYKAQVYRREACTELYIAQAGRFNVEACYGWSVIDACLADATITRLPELTHPQVQTLLGAIGAKKGFGVWVPPSDRAGLDWGLADTFELAPVLPSGYEQAARVLGEVDVVWVAPGTSRLVALYEVEHPTSIYSGLLRFNDVLILAPQARPRFGIVAGDSRRDLFARQVRRPTFTASGLSDLCSFLDYGSVYAWFKRTTHG